MSDFQGDSAVRIRGVNKNSINISNHKWGWIVGSKMPITLTVITLHYRTKCENVPLIIGISVKMFLSVFFP